MMAFLFGLSFLFIKIGLESFSALELLAYRFFLAAVLLTLLAVTKVIRIQLRGKPIRMLLLVSLFEPILYFAFETLGIQYTSSAQAGIFIALIPVFVTAMGVILLKEIPSTRQWCFISISVAGVVLILILSGSSLEGGVHLIGILFLLGAVLSAGGYNILCRKVTAYFTPIEITFVMMWIAALFFSMLYAVQRIATGSSGSFSNVFTLAGAIPLLYLGVFCSIGAYFLLNYVLSRLTVARAAVFSNLVTVVAVLAGIVYYGETFRWYEALGGLLIIVGVWGTNYYAAKDSAAQPQPPAQIY